jgi:putative ABC transport system permease protein
VLVRTAIDPLRLEPTVRAEIWAIDKDQAINYVDSLEGRITQANGASRWYTLLLGSLAAIALALSVVGVYGVISYSTAQRTHEIGVRMALGALPGHILKLVLREAVLLASAGLAIGLMAYLVVSFWLRSLVYGIAPADVSTIVPVMLILGAVAVVAAWIPARRATRLDPSIALRDE